MILSEKASLFRSKSSPELAMLMREGLTRRALGITDMNLWMLLSFIFPMLTTWSVGNILRHKNSHVIRSGAYPNETDAANVTHYFELYLVEPSLSQLWIDLPSCISVNHISITDNHFKLIEFTTSMFHNWVTIDFAQPIASKTVLLVSMQGVKYQDQSKRTWLYSIYSKALDATPGKFLDTIQVHTYSIDK